MNTGIPLRSTTLVLTLLAALIQAGCSRGGAETAATNPPPPQIPVVRAVAQIQPDELVFAGRVEATHRVEIRPRVGGVIESIHFQEGGAVRAGDLLFTLDARPYRTRRDQAAAGVARAEADTRRAEQEFSRARRLRESGAISADELDHRQSAMAAALANLANARAALVGAELDLDFTQVRAPFDGRISRAELTPGNLVQADQSVLARLVSVDPMRVRFAIDEAALQRLHASAGTANPGVRLSVTGSDRPHYGSVDYVAQAVDPATGTAELRATLSPAEGLLLDGMFARVELLLPPLRDSVLVPETALGAEQGFRYVLVAGSDGTLQQRRVGLGGRFGAQRAVVSGVTAGEAVVTAGLQFLRPGMVIQPVAAPDQPAVVAAQP